MRALVEQLDLKPGQQQHETQEHAGQGGSIGGSQEGKSFLIHLVEQHRFVALFGPPSVNTATVSKTWNERMAVIVTTKTSAGPSIGQVTRRKRSQAPSAPSRAAAS